MGDPVRVEDVTATTDVQIEVVRLPHAEGLPLPRYETAGSAGMDLAAAVPEGGLEIGPWGHALVPTGLRVALPPGFELQVRPRSGTVLKRGLMVQNSPGTVDEDYRGEVGVILLNACPVARKIGRGERIAQAVVAPVMRATWREVAELPETARGAGGFGSTGT